MKKLLALSLILLCVFCLPAAALRPFGFAELWNSAAYYDTNIEKKGFTSLLGRFEGKIGVYMGDSPLQLYGAYYSAFSQSNDYWDNYLYSGIGARFKPFESYQASGWQNEWIPDLKIFVESLGAAYFKDKASAEAAGLAAADTQYGLELWHEWNLDSPNMDLPWAELWSKLVYKQTNFGWESFNNYVFYFQPKFGRHLGKGVEAYVRTDVTLSGKKGVSYYFLNVADYGVGIRFEPFRKTENVNELLRKFKMFAEVLGVSYLDQAPLDPNKKVASDLRFGVDFSYGL